MCDCIAETNKALRDYNGTLTMVMFYDGRPSRVTISVRKLDPNIKIKPPAIYPAYCPFCGEKYKDI